MPGREDGADGRVLILATTGRDATLLEQALTKNGLIGSICDSLDGLIESLGAGAGAVLIAEEALANVPVGSFTEWTKNQPPWSDLPILLLTAGGAEASEWSARLVNALGERANVTLLERPVRFATLLSAVRSARRARQRQYEVRDYLADREKVQKQMLQTQKLESLGVLAGGVAHDFNNLLTGILGNASLALEQTAAGRPCDGLLRSVVEAAESAADLTRQLLAYAGKGQFLVRSVNLSTTVHSIATLVQTSIPKGVRIIFDLNPSLPPLLADSGQLQQVIMNLVINGAEAIGDKKRGAVRVRTQLEQVQETDLPSVVGGDRLHQGPYLLLEVEDTGSGMSDETLARIFDPFFTTKFLGRGLGLAAVLGIVRAHHGALQVRSRLGRGTTFRVYLPVNEGPTFSRIPGGDESLAPTPAHDPG